MYRNLLLGLFSVLLCTIAKGQSLGTYPLSSVIAGKNVNILPSGSPSNTVDVLVTSSPDFLGVMTANSTTGRVTINNARPAGIYTIKVKAFSSSGSSTSRTFTLEVTNPDCSQGGFDSISVVHTGLKQVAAVVGDFNRDGNQDLAATHEGGNNTLSIRLGNGNGVFSGVTELQVGSHPYSVAIADIDRDGIEDLVAANSGDNSITPLLGNGGGGFTVKPVCDVSFGPMSIVIGDFNSDGKPDLATANLNAHNISIRQGNGAGFFYGTLDISVGQYPQHIVMGDFNNDNKIDLATANSGANTVSIRLGNGAGNFTSTPDVPVGLNPYCVTVGDFNEDGNDDFVTSNYAANTVSVRFGDGTGSFYGNTELPVGSNPYHVAIGNFNGDNHADLAIANYFSNSVSLRFGNGAGGFVTGNDFHVGSYPTWVTPGNFNQDNIMDLAVSNFNDNMVSIHLGYAGVPPIDSIRTNSPVCEGMDITLDAYGGTIYEWNGPNGFVSTNQHIIQPVATMADTGLYEVTITDSANCVAITSINVVVYPLPVVTLFLINDTICSGSAPQQLIGGYPTGGIYTGHGVVGGNSFDPGLTGPGEFTVYYYYSDIHDCARSDSAKFFVTVCNEVEDISNSLMTISPNPVNSAFIVYYKGVLNSDLLLYTLQGSLVRKWDSLKSDRSTFSIDGLSNGIYFLHANVGNRKVVQKIVISR